VLFMRGCLQKVLSGVLLLTQAVSGGDDGAAFLDAETTFATVCAACHGDRGQGRVDLRTPSIAALPYWYVEAQLGKFRRSIRGAEPGDKGGALMHAVAGGLTDGQIKGLAAHVGRLPRNPTRDTLKGDLARGEWLFTEICRACHRYNASGEKVFGSPPLYGLQDWYMAMQLKKFSEGVRGAHREDVKGAKMREVAVELSDADRRAVASYVSVLAARHLPERQAERAE